MCSHCVSTCYVDSAVCSNSAFKAAHVLFHDVSGQNETLETSPETSPNHETIRVCDFLNAVHFHPGIHGLCIVNIAALKLFQFVFLF